MCENEEEQKQKQIERDLCISFRPFCAIPILSERGPFTGLESALPRRERGGKRERQRERHRERQREREIQSTKTSSRETCTHTRLISWDC